MSGWRPEHHLRYFRHRFCLYIYPLHPHWHTVTHNAPGFRYFTFSEVPSTQRTPHGSRSTAPRCRLHLLLGSEQGHCLPSREEVLVSSSPVAMRHRKGVGKLIGHELKVACGVSFPAIFCLDYNKFAWFLNVMLNVLFYSLWNQGALSSLKCPAPLHFQAGLFFGCEPCLDLYVMLILALSFVPR